MIGRFWNIIRMPTTAMNTPTPPSASPVLIAWRQGVVFASSARLAATSSKAMVYARFFARASPNRPCGRKISTMSSTVKAMRSRN